MELDPAEGQYTIGSLVVAVVGLLLMLKQRRGLLLQNRHQRPHSARCPVVVGIILVTDETVTTGAVLLASFCNQSGVDKNSPVKYRENC